ncbi:MAG: PIN domain-containing protein [Candidatus Aenigmatarchaeota archaeon]
MKIILDANFLVDAVRYKVDIFDQLKGNKLYVLDSIIFELEKITERRTKESTLARIALELIKRKAKIIKTNKKTADPFLIKYSKKGYAIATHDKVLKNKLKKIGAKVIYIRQKKYVFI